MNESENGREAEQDRKTLFDELRRLALEAPHPLILPPGAEIQILAPTRPQEPDPA